MRRHFFFALPGLALLVAAAHAQTISITTTSLPNGRVGAAYSQSIATSGGKKPFTWSVSAGALPGGLALDNGGTISGTPTAAGSSSFTVQVVDKGGASDVQGLAITVDPLPLSVTTASLPAGTVGSAYSATLAATGGSGGYTWSSTGALPAGLALSAAGAISGTPTAAGASTFTVTVTDSGSRTASKALAITIAPDPPPAITTASLPNGTVGAAYSATLAASGGNGALTWTSTGALPAGLTLSAAGVISGTPTAAGTSNFTVTVTDSANQTASKALSITIAPPALTITTASLPAGTVGVAYSATLAATGGSGGFTWTAAGALPAGLTLSAAGAIGGTPTAAGTSNFTVTVTDSGNRTASKALSITIAPPALTVTTASLPDGTVGVAYSATLAATGGTGGFTWTAAGALPAGLTLSSAGAIAGTPTAAGTSNFTVTVTDSGNRTASKPLAITIAAPTLIVTTASLPDGTVGVAYSATLAATGGTGGFTWTAAGALPAGLTLSSAGAIAGTPTAAGTSTFTVTVADSANHTASKPLAITIAAPTLIVTTASLPDGTVGVAYSATLAATGGTGGFTWTSFGTLPAGLTLSAAGAIGGTPTAAGTSNFTVTVTDSGNRTASKPLAITIAAPTLIVTTASLPDGTVGVAYSATLAATGGTGGFTWTSTGTLPAGLTVSAAGAIGGTPTAAGTSTFTVTVADSANHTASKPLAINIAAPAITITTTSLPGGNVGTPYSATLAATGGAGGNTWSVIGGSLPPGLTLSPGGILSGTPSVSITSNFIVQVKDLANTTATRPLSLNIAPPTLIVVTASLSSAEQGAPYSQTLAATGGAGGYLWSVGGGALPAGLALDATGRIFGTPTGATSTFTAQVTDSAGAVATRSLTIPVASGPSLAAQTTLPSGVIGAPYSTTVVVNGGQAPFSFTLLSGQLPPGLALNAATGEIAGRPGQVGAFPFSLQARDVAGAPAQGAFTITIAGGLTITTAPVLPTASISVPYQAALLAAGGTAPYTFSITAGALPGGLTFHPDGRIDGTPSAAGSFTFTAAVDDANGARSTKDFSLTVAASLTITTAPQLPSGTPGASYAATLAASGGTAPYVWSVSAGALPPGLTLDAKTGVLDGAPTTAGSYNFTATVTDSVNIAVQKAFTLAISPGLSFTTPAALPNAVAGAPYSFTLQASGGKTPYTWRVSAGALPDGLTLNGSSGAIAGTPSAAGTFNFTVEVADGAGQKVSRVHTIVATLPSLPALSLAGVPSTLAALQQPAIDLTLATPYPVAITGRLNLAFVPASGMPDDPAVQFSSGGRSAAFTIAANSTHATFAIPQLAVQSGSVAGAIQFTVESLAAGPVALPAPSGPVQTAQAPASAALIRSVAVTRTNGGFQVQIVGASNTRELASATVRFRPTAGATLDTSEVTLPLSNPARAWFQSSSSTAYGGQFTLTLPFSIVGGSAPIDSVVVILTNAVGASQEASAQY